VLEAGLVGSVRVLSNLFNQIGQTEGSHVGRVETIAARIAARCGMSKGDIRHLRIAALLHDIGQFGMPDRMRNLPPWALDGPELVVFKNYPLISAVLLSEVPGAEVAVQLIEAHAENFDGTGFPEGLKGDAIPLGARIIRIADGCDTYAMHAAEGRTLEGVRMHLQAQKGKAYDPELVNSTFTSLRESRFTENTEETQEVSALSLRPGMVLAENVYDPDGRFLAREGAQLTESMVPRVRQLLGSQPVKVTVDNDE